MKPREYCCCAIPLVNAGIYATLLQQLALAVIAGTLAVGTPSIVGAHTPTFAPALFGIVCYIGAALQFVGLYGAYKEKPQLFHRYVQLHMFVTVAAFALGAAWIILSATGHSTAKANCLTKFFPDEGSSDSNTEGSTMCEIFPWVDVGLMGGLLVLLAIVQLYLFVVISSYSSIQRDDHRKFDSEYDAINPLRNSIPLADRSDPWDSRMSTDSMHDVPQAGAVQTGYRDLHQDSVPSVSPSNTSPVRMRSSRTYQGFTLEDPVFPTQPQYAYTQEPDPTPLNQMEYNSASAGVDRPEQIVYHPAEGSFGRKTPRQPSADQYQDPYYNRR